MHLEIGDELEGTMTYRYDYIDCDDEEDGDIAYNLDVEPLGAGEYDIVVSQDTVRIYACELTDVDRLECTESGDLLVLTKR